MQLRLTLQCDLHEVFFCRIALTRTGSALPLVSFWTRPINLFRTFLFPLLIAWTCREAHNRIFGHVFEMFHSWLHTTLCVSPDLIWMRVHHLLADAVQLCGVTNKPQVLLLGDLQGCLAWWPPHLLEHLRTRRNPWNAGEKQNTNKRQLGCVCWMTDRKGIIALSV